MYSQRELIGLGKNHCHHVDLSLPKSEVTFGGSYDNYIVLKAGLRGGLGNAVLSLFSALKESRLLSLPFPSELTPKFCSRSILVSDCVYVHSKV